MAPKSTKAELACLSLGLELELAPSTSAFIGLASHMIQLRLNMAVVS